MLAMTAMEEYVIHVFGSPCDGHLLGFDERLCTEPETRSCDVVYHVQPVEMTNGRYACKACGETADGYDSTFPPSLTS